MLPTPGYESHSCFHVESRACPTLAGFHPCTTRRLPVALQQSPLNWSRDGFPRPVVFKKRRDQCSPHGRLQKCRNPRRSLLGHLHRHRKSEEASLLLRNRSEEHTSELQSL